MIRQQKSFTLGYRSSEMLKQNKINYSGVSLEKQTIKRKTNNGGQVWMFQQRTRTPSRTGIEALVKFK